MPHIKGAYGETEGPVSVPIISSVQENPEQQIDTLLRTFGQSSQGEEEVRTCRSALLGLIRGAGGASIPATNMGEYIVEPSLEA